MLLVFSVVFVEKFITGFLTCMWINMFHKKYDYAYLLNREL